MPVEAVRLAARQSTERARRAGSSEARLMRYVAWQKVAVMTGLLSWATRYS
jgi:hypothetical protein